jgi:hypothetical protein
MLKTRINRLEQDSRLQNDEQRLTVTIVRFSDSPLPQPHSMTFATGQKMVVKYERAPAQ